MDYTSNLNLYKWNATDKKKDTVAEMAKSMDVIDAQLAESTQKHITNSKTTYGTFENAVVSSVIANGAGENKPQIIGITPENDAILATYPDRDSAAHYRANRSRSPVLSVDSVTYTVNSVTVPAGIDLSNVKVGMIIDTKHATKYSGIISAINGLTISVYNWYQMGNTAKGQIPTNDFGINISPTTKIWVDNLNAFLESADPLTACSIVEYGLWNHKQDGIDACGSDMVSQGSFRGSSAYRSRSTGNHNKWEVGFDDYNSDVALQSRNIDPEKSLIKSTTTLFEIKNNGLMNRLKGVIGNSGQSLTIDPNAVVGYIISQATDHQIAHPSSGAGNMLFVFNITNSNVLIGGIFDNPYAPGSIQVPAHGFKCLVSDGGIWYHS